MRQVLHQITMVEGAVEQPSTLSTGRGTSIEYFDNVKDDENNFDVDKLSVILVFLNIIFLLPSHPVPFLSQCRRRPHETRQAMSHQ